ncbi:tetratricopeptide repeat containing domain protein [Babesia bovis T2Bo]|uniref:Tetratricopeptide repeat containing domain protein n=1 Tax=Babesia bovis TaxID=5865 RepID=A7AR01_BABBO|nr:tetratricopeptide repeat containing domain protein [Babesia bovis T2Bo]EDO06970.1 tetratricopeptide repeat containing domain protein [Babesia bovis T2Bo]|eukprot:XP_001610538.1 tetratricopeptide repeat containing domain protein [Babesia bovis T2Bo]
MESYCNGAMIPQLELILLAPCKESRERAISYIKDDVIASGHSDLLDLVTFAAEGDVYRGVTLLDRCMGQSVFLDVDPSVAISCQTLYDHLVSRVHEFISNGSKQGLERIYVLAGLVLLLNTFIRLNWLGPPCGCSSESDKHLASRYSNKAIEDPSDNDVTLDTYGSVTDKGASFSAFAIEKVSLEYTQRCILGSPDLRYIDLEQGGYATLVASILDALEIDGETVYSGVYGSPYFVAALAFLGCLNGSIVGQGLSSNSVLTKESSTLNTVGIWQGRVAFIWQRIVRNSTLNPCPTLFRTCVIDFGESLKSCGILPQDFNISVCDPLLLKEVNIASVDVPNTVSTGMTFLANSIKPDLVSRFECPGYLRPLLILELGVRLPYYNMSRLFDSLLNIASSTLNFGYTFTGKLGIRRKHQVRETAQLVLVTDRSNDNGPSGTKDEHGNASVPENIGLISVNDDSDILERPRLSEEADESQLSLAEQCLLLCHALHMLKSTPESDELNLEFLNAIVVRCLDNVSATTSWLLTSVALWVRCKTEYHRTKTVERATLQLYKLSDAYYEPSAAPGARLEYIWNVWYPSAWGIKREIARRMSSIGSFLTAFEIYKQLHMWEDAIQCLIIVGRKKDALELVNQQLKTAPSALLWCFLGDIEGDISHYKTAWEVSKHRCARAQRTLGSYYFNKGDLDQAIASLELALSINPMRESSQFMLGCCYLKKGSLERAISVFARVVSMNPSCHDAWANMCSAHLNIGNMKEATICIEQAVKHNGNKWEFWDIRMRIALRSRDIQNVCFAMEKLISLGKKSAIDPLMVAFLVDASTKFDRNHATQRIIARTLDTITKHITDNGDIWSQCARYFGFQKCYLEALECTFREYRALESEIVTSLTEAKGDLEKQRENDVNQIKRVTSCLGAMVSLLKRMSVSDRRDKRATVIETLRSVRERIHSRIEAVNAQWQMEMDSLIENAEVEDVVCVYADE